MPDEQLSYEEALARLDERLAELEKGQLTLEQAIEAVESGRRYLAICQRKLDQARQKIETMPVAEEGMDLPLAAPPDPISPEGARRRRRAPDTEPEEIPF